MRLFFKLFLLLYLALLLGDGASSAAFLYNKNDVSSVSSQRPDADRQLQLKAIEVEEYDYKLVSVQKYWRFANLAALFYADAFEYKKDNCNLLTRAEHSIYSSKRYILLRVFRI